MATIDVSQINDRINPAFIPALNCKDRYLILMGGAGSGKSVAIAQKIILRILIAINRGEKHTFLCLRKTQPAARKSIFPLFLHILDSWGMRKLYKYNKTDMTISFKGGCAIIITGLDDKDKIKSIFGITSIWLEEITEFTYEDLQQLDLRLRGVTWDYKQIMMSFNPIDENHWLRTRVFSDAVQAEIEEGNQYVRREHTQVIKKKTIKYATTYMHSTFEDNKFLDDVYRAKLQNLIKVDTNYYNVYCLGLWGLLKGLIYDNWDVVDDFPDDLDQRGFGMDFGFSVDPTAVVEVGFRGNDLYVRERLYETGLTNQTIAEHLRGITEGHADCITVADSAEPKSIVEIRVHGQLCLPSAKGKDSVVYGIQRIKQFHIHVTADSSNLIKEIHGYKWAEDRNGIQQNKPVKFNDHLLDALRYIVTKLREVRRYVWTLPRTKQKRASYGKMKL
jgi:phage terminase large subunit